MKKLLLLPLILLASCSSDDECCNKVIKTEYGIRYSPTGEQFIGGTFTTLNSCTGEETIWFAQQTDSPVVGDCYQ